MNGVNGFSVRGRGDYASASIFLPCVGHSEGTSLCYAGLEGYYWSSVPDSYDVYACFLYFELRDYVYHTTFFYERNDGRSVRPVQGFTE